MANTIRINTDYPSITASMELYRRAEQAIPCATQTLAKGRSQLVFGVSPLFIQKAKGAYVWDVDGNQYLDYTMAVGPLSLGYAYTRVDDAICAQLEQGITFSLPHPLEVELAETLQEIIPNAESVRFSKTGADVTSAAVRLARAYTGRNTILCCGYHGWHDWYIATTDRNAGIPLVMQELTYTFNYNDIASLEAALDDDVAAVILEPITFAEPDENFLHKVRDLCTRNGSLLIFDEMWTGFRLATGGAQEYFGVKADLACFSKAIANGMPLSVLTGKRSIMQLLEQDVFFFTTFGGETLSLAAAQATIAELREKNVPSVLEENGNRLKRGILELLTELDIPYVSCIGFPCRTMLTFMAKDAANDALSMKSYIHQELLKRGILWNGFHTMSYSHSLDDIHYTLQVYREVLSLLRDAVYDNTLRQRLQGEAMQPVFRKTTNFNTKPKQTQN